MYGDAKNPNSSPIVTPKEIDRNQLRAKRYLIRLANTTEQTKLEIRANLNTNSASTSIIGSFNYLLTTEYPPSVIGTHAHPIPYHDIYLAPSG